MSTARLTMITERTNFGQYSDGSSVRNVCREADIDIRQRSQMNIESER